MKPARKAIYWIVHDEDGYWLVGRDECYGWGNMPAPTDEIIATTDTLAEAERLLALEIQRSGE